MRNADLVVSRDFYKDMVKTALNTMVEMAKAFEKAETHYRKRLKEQRDTIVKQIFEWEKEHKIVPICSAHQIPKAGCEQCAFVIRARLKPTGPGHDVDKFYQT